MNAAATTTTICAVASPPGGGRRAVLRLSGPDAADVVRACCTVNGAPPALAGRAVLEARLDDGVGSQPALLLWMPGPRSYTREDVAELHVVGSPPLVRAALARLLRAGAVPAGPGEFTRRAFLNGRLDLTRAEGVLELIGARDEAERRAAAALLEGGLDRRVGGLRDRMEELRAVTEASLDFDEGDTGHIPAAELAAAARELLAGVEEAVGWEARREPASGAPRVVLAGAPNAGKSTLFNRLTGVEGALAPALVSPHAGTTRDVKTAPWTAGGIEVLLVDTAGADGGPDGDVAPGPAETAARTAARRARAAADLVVGVVEAVAGDEVDGADVLVWSQVDRPGARPAPAGAVAVSAVRGEGLEELERAVGRALSAGRGGAGRELSARHLAALGTAAERLRAGIEGLEGGLPLDLFAEGLREATGALDGITGRTTPEDVLDRIFARFCLGK